MAGRLASTLMRGLGLVATRYYQINRAGLAADGG
jgi:hypothetical protein